MKYLYAPWRKTYSHNSAKKSSLCPFCEQVKSDDDAAHYIIARYQHCFLLLNLYPYNAGHVMVIPNRHVAHLHKLTPEERAEMMEITTHATVILKKALKAKAFNIGANFGGKAAGGSIPRHLHMHILPRWAGDTAFLTALADTKMVSSNLPELYETLKKAFQKKSAKK